MRIAYDHTIFARQKFGGISRYFFELANNLTGTGSVGVECLINSPLYINGYLRHAKPQLQIFGIAMPLFRGARRIYGSINALVAPFNLSKWEPDIVHETYYSGQSFAPPGSRIIVTVHDMLHELYPEYFSARDRTREYKKAAVARADHVICVSENTRQDLIRLLKVPPERTTVVHHGLSLTQTESADTGAQGRPFLLYVGERGGYKNFERLLTAYGSRRELFHHYDFVAFGGGGFKPREADLIKRLNLRVDRVRHSGGDDRMLAALYKRAAIFVYPSLYEGFGIPPLEAMAFDCPVACSNTSSIPEVVSDAALQFDPLEVDSIADALVKLCSDSALRLDLIHRGRARAEAFSWRKCARQTMEVYRFALR